MNLNFTIDWKFVLALSTGAAVMTLAIKMDAAAAERVLTHLLDTHKGYAIA